MSLHLALIGGGHSHAIVLRHFASHPLPGLRITLISETPDSPYSGMLPGHIGGLYSYRDCHIDLQALCRSARVAFQCDRVTGLDLANSKILGIHDTYSFDLLSLDIGSTPTLPAGAEIHPFTTAAKPVRPFLDWWQALLNSAQPGLQLGIIGGGTGGVELALHMHQRLTQQLGVDAFAIHLFQRDRTLLPQQNPWVQREFRQLFQVLGIHLHEGETVIQAVPPAVICQSGLQIPCDRIVWVTQASAPSWLAATGLTLDDRGFILVRPTLQSCSHAHIFASGDVASIDHHPCPKAGVFAVRQGPPLFYNLRAAAQNLLRGQSIYPTALQSYRPQRFYLSLIGLGDGSAVASYGRWGWRSPLLWRWKEHIDRAFMAYLRD